MDILHGLWDFHSNREAFIELKTLQLHRNLPRFQGSYASTLSISNKSCYLFTQMRISFNTSIRKKDRLTKQGLLALFGLQHAIIPYLLDTFVHFLTYMHVFSSQASYHNTYPIAHT
jgi:hypothetical protein